MRITFFILLFYFSSALACFKLDMAMAPCSSKLPEELSTKTIINDSFMLDLIKETLSFSRVKELYESSDDKAFRFDVPEVHDLSSSNSTILIKDMDDFLSYHLSGENSFPLCVIISTRKINSSDSELIGKPLSYFKNLFDFREDVDVLIIEDLEGGSSVELLFMEGNLSSFLYRTTYFD